jgi:hypothetical protein
LNKPSAFFHTGMSVIAGFDAELLINSGHWTTSFRTSWDQTFEVAPHNLCTMSQI